jgi:hypothetical protein
MSAIGDKYESVQLGTNAISYLITHILENNWKWKLESFVGLWESYITTQT